MRRVSIVAVTALLMAGCQAQSEAWESTVLLQTSAAAAFVAARDVLAEDYLVARADETAGAIDTRPLAVRKTGAERKAGAYVSSGEVQNFRRIVRCRIEGGQAGAVVRLAAHLQREGTSQADALLIGVEGADERTAGAERRWRHLDPRQTSYWADVGRDREAEADLLRRIRERVRETNPPPTPAP
jgi:hypothetical protein